MEEAHGNEQVEGGRREIRNLRTKIMRHQERIEMVIVAGAVVSDCSAVMRLHVPRWQRLRTFATKCNGLVDNLFCQKT